MFYRAVLFALLLLCGCTTVREKFQTMSPDERAVAVCKRKKDIQNLQGRIASLKDSINNSQNDLARGYKIHRQCQQVEVYGNSSVTCTTVGSQVTCNEKKPVSYKQVCTETPVKINVELEKENISNWSQSVTSLSDQVKAKWRKCYEFIYPLSADDAYEYY